MHKVWLVDALATAGTGLGMTLSTQTPLGTAVQFVSDPKDPNAPQVTATTPVVLNAGATVGNQLIGANYRTVLYKFTAPADNYVTQLTLSAGSAAQVLLAWEDPERIQRGLAWLKREQRVSGRWWMQSLYRGNYQYITYIATCQALKALALCGELQ